MNYEQFATAKHPRKGKCRKSCFANRNHRVGIVPVMSLLDGGAAGDSCREICLECGKVFKNPRWFVFRNQPNKLLKSTSWREYEQGKGKRGAGV